VQPRKALERIGAVQEMPECRHHAWPQSPVAISELLFVGGLEAFQMCLEDLIERTLARMPLSIAARRHAPEQGRLRAGRG
jgi:hypothetical protein